MRDWEKSFCLYLEQEEKDTSSESSLSEEIYQKTLEVTTLKNISEEIEKIISDFSTASK